MKQTPIIMSGDHPKLVLDGIKTQTRRVINPQPRKWVTDDPEHPSWSWGGGTKKSDLLGTDTDGLKAWCPSFCPYGQVGDQLWLKHKYNLFDIYYKPLPYDIWPNYTAGTDGHIYRMDKGEPYQLKEASTGNGYLSVSLSRGSYKATQNVHRLICQAFYGSDDHQKSQVRHLDGNGENNLPSNLDWGTQEDNWLDRKYHGRGMGEQHHNSKLTVQQVLEIRASKKSQRQLAFQYGITQATIQNVTSGNTWKESHRQHCRNYPEWQGWKSPLFMPRWASRITLEITEVRAERVQEISLRDCYLELGIPLEVPMGLIPTFYMFRKLWDSLNAKRGYGWASNPFVWCISFKLLDK